jgi:hypothetical protein
MSMVGSAPTAWWRRTKTRELLQVIHDIDLPRRTQQLDLGMLNGAPTVICCFHVS